MFICVLPASSHQMHARNQSDSVRVRQSGTVLCPRRQVCALIKRVPRNRKLFLSSFFSLFSSLLFLLFSSLFFFLLSSLLFSFPFLSHSVWSGMVLTDAYPALSDPRLRSQRHERGGLQPAGAEHWSSQNSWWKVESRTFPQSQKEEKGRLGGS